MLDQEPRVAQVDWPLVAIAVALVAFIVWIFWEGPAEPT